MARLLLGANLRRCVASQIRMASDQVNFGGFGDSFGR